MATVISDSSGEGDVATLGDAVPSVGQLVRAARERRHWSQQRLASELRKTKQWINSIEKDDLPSLEQLVRLHGKLLAEERAERSASLGYWLLAWMAQHSQRVSSDERKAITETIRDALPLFANVLGARSSPRSPLVDFPSRLERLAIICGDRREIRAHSGGDLFADSASVLDLRFLGQLRLGLRDVPIWHDKVFVQMSEEYLRRQFGQRDLLVVGSPAVNFAARRLNNHAVFRFNIPAHMRKLDAMARERFPRPLPFVDQHLLKFEREHGIFRLQDRPDVELVDEALNGHTPSAHPGHWTEAEREAAHEVAQMVLGGCTLRTWVKEFRPLEIADPAVGCLWKLEHDKSKRLAKDHALVSLANNPFADDESRVSILVAGIHGPGTAHALRALIDNSHDFHDRPLGGVLEVSLAPDRDLPERVSEASVEWLTAPYTSGDVLSNLDSPAEFATEWPDSVEDWKQIVRALNPQEAGDEGKGEA